MLITLLVSCLQSQLVPLPIPQHGSIDTQTFVDTAADTSVFLAEDSGDTEVYLDITSLCEHEETGPDRDCGFTYRGKSGCLLDEPVLYDFGPDPLLNVQVMRICLTTRSEGIPCIFDERVSQSLGAYIRFICPPLVPGGDPDVVIGGNGGGFSVYTAEAYE